MGPVSRRDPVFCEAPMAAQCPPIGGSDWSVTSSQAVGIRVGGHASQVVQVLDCEYVLEFSMMDGANDLSPGLIDTFCTLPHSIHSKHCPM